MTCTNEGVLTLWQNGDKVKEINTDKQVSSFQQCGSTKNLLVTGGKDNNTKVWDINTATTTFTAKNVSILIYVYAYIYILIYLYTGTA